MNKTYNDSKYFVDQPSRSSPCSIRHSYLKNKNWKSLLELPGADLTTPKKNNMTEDKSFNGFINHLDDKWDLLTLQTKESWKVQTSIQLPYPFVIPGGRFREAYYWDNYFIIKGLLSSANRQPKHLFTAYGIIQNFIHMMKLYGFIPNGARTYYLNRSQPPLFTWMVWNYFDVTKNMTFLRESLPYIQQEIDFFHNNRMSNVTINTKSYKVFHFDSDNKLPRPESYFEDFSLLNNGKFGQEHELFRHIGAAAESGWDFSSRWYKTNFKEMYTASVMPVDLNYIMLKNYKLIASIMNAINPNKYAARIQYFYKLYNQRFLEFQNVFFNKNDNMWYDILPTNEQNKVYYASNLTPLWTVANDLPNIVNMTQLMEQVSKLQKTTGIPVSMKMSGQQWDYPNVWPPMQYLIIKGVGLFDNKLAKQLSDAFIGNVYCIWHKTNVIYEKYNCCSREAGHGGEYEVQEGFGWTNGVVLDLVEEYGQSLQCPVFDEEVGEVPILEDNERVSTAPRIFMILGESIILCGILYFLRKPKHQQDISMNVI